MCNKINVTRLDPSTRERENSRVNRVVAKQGSSRWLLDLFLYSFSLSLFFFFTRARKRTRPAYNVTSLAACTWFFVMNRWTYLTRVDVIPRPKGGMDSLLGKGYRKNLGWFCAVARRANARGINYREAYRWIFNDAVQILSRIIAPLLGLEK